MKHDSWNRTVSVHGDVSICWRERWLGLYWRSKTGILPLNGLESRFWIQHELSIYIYMHNQCNSMSNLKWRHVMEHGLKNLKADCFHETIQETINVNPCIFFLRVSFWNTGDSQATPPLPSPAKRCYTAGGSRWMLFAPSTVDSVDSFPLCCRCACSAGCCDDRWIAWSLKLKDF